MYIAVCFTAGVILVLLACITLFVIDYQDHKLQTQILQASEQSLVAARQLNASNNPLNQPDTIQAYQKIRQNMINIENNSQRLIWGQPEIKKNIARFRAYDKKIYPTLQKLQDNNLNIDNTLIDQLDSTNNGINRHNKNNLVGSLSHLIRQTELITNQFNAMITSSEPVRELLRVQQLVFEIHGLKQSLKKLKIYLISINTKNIKSLDPSLLTDYKTLIASINTFEAEFNDPRYRRILVSAQLIMQNLASLNLQQIIALSKLTQPIDSTLSQHFPLLRDIAKEINTASIQQAYFLNTHPLLLVLLLVALSMFALLTGYYWSGYLRSQDFMQREQLTMALIRKETNRLVIDLEALAQKNYQLMNRPNLTYLEPLAIEIEKLSLQMQRSDTIILQNSSQSSASSIINKVKSTIVIPNNKKINNKSIVLDTVIMRDYLDSNNKLI